MADLIARVKKGRLVLDVPTDLPEGTRVPLARKPKPVKLGDDIADPAERARFLKGIRESIRQADRGETVPAEVVLKELRRMRLTRKNRS